MFFIAWKFTSSTNYLTEKDVVVPVHVRQELGIEKEVELERSISDPEVKEKV